MDGMYLGYVGTASIEPAQCTKYSSCEPPRSPPDRASSSGSRIIYTWPRLGSYTVGIVVRSPRCRSQGVLPLVGLRGGTPRTIADG
jgi:hypothetical protein